MGVIRNVTSLSNSISDSIEDVLEDIENGVQNQEPEPRRPRKIKHRSGRPHAVGGIHIITDKSGKKKKRYENSNYLLSLADPDEARELTIHDFIPQTTSVFSEIFMQRESIEIWNDFINCTDNEDWFKTNLSHLQESENAEKAQQTELPTDGRGKHPAYSSQECLKKIDGDLRCMLRKKHVPLGTLMYLENELVTFFINRPQSVYHCQIPSSFQRLMVHALSQYMDLSSLSYNRNGTRWTRVLNKNSIFFLPPTLLSSYVEKRQHKTSH